METSATERRLRRTTSPKHTFADNGTYPVTLTVTDANDVSHSNTIDVVVKNAPPTISLTSVEASFDLATFGPIDKLHMQIDDPGSYDAFGLHVKVTSSRSGFPNVAEVVAPAGEAIVTVPIAVPPAKPLASGYWPITMTVTDKDGGTATTSTVLQVQPPAPAPSGPSRRLHNTAALTHADPVAPSVPTYTGFVIDKTTAATGDAVTARNVSRTNGVAAAATLTPGDARPDVALAAGAASVLTYLNAGTFTIAAKVGNTTARTDVMIAGADVTANLAYTGATSGAVGEPAAVRAKVTRAGGAAVAGREVDFTLGSTTVVADTASDGVAAVALPIPAPAGAQTLHVVLTPTGLGAGASVDVPFTVTANTPPIAHAGGPYNVELGGALSLTGSGSDVDPGDANALTFAWDLNGDGVFDDATGNAPAVSAADVQSKICGGTCSPGQSAGISLRVNDPKGAIATDTTTVTIARDFVLGISPSSALLVPSASTSFSVRVSTNSGFTGLVALTAPGLPTGVSASFVPQQVVPNATSVLTLSASPAITAQNFSLVVVGKSGTITHQIGSTLDLEFGLVPECFGTLAGKVTDVDTGLPIAGADITDFSGRTTPAVSAADGTYQINKVPLVGNNAPVQLSLSAATTGYLTVQQNATVVCNVTTDFSPALRCPTLRCDRRSRDGGRRAREPHWRSHRGRVGDRRRSERCHRRQRSFLVLEAHVGSRQRADERLAERYREGVPARGQVHSRECRHDVERRHLDVPDLHRHGHCTRRRRHDRPARHVGGRGRSQLGAGGRRWRARRRSRTYRSPRAVGRPTSSCRRRRGRPCNPDSATRPATIPGCGGTAVVDIPVHVPVPVFANIDATVTNAEGGAAIAGATIFGNNLNSPATDQNGHVLWNFPLGLDGPSSLSLPLIAQKPGFWDKHIDSVTVNKDQTTTVAFAMLPIHTASVEGFVRDVDTGAPIPNADLFVSGLGIEVFADANGHYRFDGISLSTDNQPRLIDVQSFANGYWNDFAETTLHDGVVTRADITMVKQCSGATVRGRVLNAVTHDPIAGAKVVELSFNTSTLTDTSGRFALDVLPSGQKNAPWQQTIEASKTGFVTADKVITLFCGADVIVDFGRPDSAFGTVSGHVTGTDGKALAGIFVGSSFGGSGTTDANGAYTIKNAPLADNGGAATWNITAQPAAGPA